MNKLFLRAGSKSAMRAKLNAAGLMAYDEDGKLQIVTGAQTDVYELGEIQQQTGTETDPETGEDVPVYTPLDGWHCNVITRDPELPAKLASVTLTEPTTPYCTWF